METDGKVDLHFGPYFQFVLTILLQNVLTCMVEPPGESWLRLDAAKRSMQRFSVLPQRKRTSSDAEQSSAEEVSRGGRKHNNDEMAPRLPPRRPDGR